MALWRVLESADVTILLEMNKYFNKLMTKLDMWSQDAGVLLQGDVELESDYPPRKDEIWHHLITPTEYDATTQEILEILCHAFFYTAFSISSDHLPVEHTVIPLLELVMKLNQFLKLIQ